jgi:3-methyladenine DNA glycosylase AlkD
MRTECQLALAETQGLAAFRSLTTERVRDERRRMSKALQNCRPQDMLELAFALVDRDRTWDRFLAYELLLHHPGALASYVADDFERLGRGMDSWYDVDMFACAISGQAWRMGVLGDDLIRVWAVSADPWWRRAALVSTVPLNVKAQGGHGDPVRTLDICSRLIDDRQDMVVKALSWALRALSGPRRRVVEEWLDTHRKRLAPRVIREVENKLRSGLKNPRGANIRGAGAETRAKRSSPK